MNKTLVAILISLVVGFAVAAVVNRPVAIPHMASDTADSGRSVSFDRAAPLEQRIRSLEQAVSDERMARQLLQDEVLILTMELERLSPDVGLVEVEAPVETTVVDSRENRRAEYARRNSREGRKGRLIEAGFQPGRAELIVQRESELQMQALQERYDAQRDGTPFDYSQGRNSSDNTLRAELGDADYERYLEASGRSTSVAISNVIESSPGQRAGLQNGDEIVRYDGARVFSMSDLNSLTMDGDPGVNITVDIIRDGIPMQVVLPRGPVGISAGRRYSR
jgi:membrane-associated protease RseP (regulator of RpoE activity)